MIPSFLLPHTVTVEPYEGSGANGPRFGPAVTVRCYREDKRRLVRASNGDQVISETTVWCQLGTVAPPKSRVDLGDRKAEVIVCGRLDGGALPVPSHLEVNCT